MSKTEDIPQEVWDAAKGLVYEKFESEEAGITGVARAILAAKAEERETCAQVASTYAANMSIWMGSEWPTAKLATNYAGQDIAAAIRKREG